MNTNRLCLQDYEGRDCKQLTADQVPQAVVERCGDRPMYYALTQCKNNGKQNNDTSFILYISKDIQNDQ